MSYMIEWEEREKQELVLDEGKRLEPYQDTEGYWTVGIGHLIGPKKPDYISISNEECDDMFWDDFQKAYDGAQRVVACFNALDGPRKGALVNMVFNLGEKGLSQFHTFLGALNNEDYKLASEAMLQSRWATQVGKRATRLSYRIREGAYKPR